MNSTTAQNYAGDKYWVKFWIVLCIVMLNLEIESCKNILEHKGHRKTIDIYIYIYICKQKYNDDNKEEEEEEELEPATGD